MTVYPLRNPVQNYPWGSTSEIPELLGTPNPEKKPVAELWLGAHPKAPSIVLRERCEQSLVELVEAEPEAVLGADAVRRFGPRLPFLLKVLAAEKALALQVHPTEAQAVHGFQRENALGMRLDAPQRNYLDRFHKPELICALGPFECLVGFRSVKDIAAELKLLESQTIEEDIDSFARLQNSDALRRLFESIMSMERARQQRLVREVVEKAMAAGGDLYRWIVELDRQYPGDIGVLSPLLLNLLRLHPGQAVYLAPGTVHAYLGGLGIELMANSDNVARGGLSARHVDRPEFLSLLRYDDRPGEPLDPVEVDGGLDEYEVPAADFRLFRIRLERGVRYTSERSRAVEILICTGGTGKLHVDACGPDYGIQRGDSFLVPAESPPYAIEGEATLFKATV
jgi:mannose-6-phosphate isomerase